MRVVLISKALVVGAYQRKAEEIAAQGVELTVLIPPSWHDRRGRQLAEAIHTQGYDLRVIPLALNGNYHLHFYPTLAATLRQIRPDVLHVDEEPYNLATWLAVRAGQAVGAQTLFFTWQNLDRRYPPPFAWMEAANYRACPVALAGNQDAAAVLRRKGYIGEIHVIPQFGVDPMIFSPSPERQDRPFQIGYAGGLLEEKGVDLLLRACAGLTGDWRLTLVGSGAAQSSLRALAVELGIAHRVDLGRRLAAHEMPSFYRGLDAFVLPSRSRPNWKEQFGRVLIEAMSCGVPVIGSRCGEIPNVLGEAGLIFDEEDVSSLSRHLQDLMDDPTLRAHLSTAGRRRIEAHYTMRQIAAETVNVYREIVTGD
ncbi:glycosyltransferase [bacterium]|nr:glycosyltransferase [bacterium]